jgi:hypothetical protein
MASILKREYVGMKIRPDLIAAIDAIADADGRSRSNMIERMLLEWVKEHRPDLLPKE